MCFYGAREQKGTLSTSIHLHLFYMIHNAGLHCVSYKTHTYKNHKKSQKIGAYLLVAYHQFKSCSLISNKRVKF